MLSGRLSRWLALAIALTFVGTWLAPSGYCQTVSGTIVGTVKDTSGGVIPNAKVVVTNQATNASQEAATNNLGDFEVPFLPVGTYTVRVSVTGFQTTVREGIVLRVDDTARVDATLQPGRLEQEVRVTGLASLLQTEDASTGSVIENERIENLPLNGRNFLQLTQLSADVNSGAHGTYNRLNNITLAQKGVSLSAQGQRDDSTSFLLDGANVRGAYLGSITMVPSIDSIQEFKMKTTGYSAQYGTSPVQLNVATKSGSNAIHGSAYDFVRNTSLNARDAFATTKLPYHQNQFGGTVGGPVYVPKVYNGKDRSFFFFAYEGKRQPVVDAATPSMPPTAMRNGDFSVLLPDRIIYDPETYDPVLYPTAPYMAPFAGNIIPSDQLNPHMVPLLNQLPEPTRPGLSRNYDGYSPANSDIEDYLVRIDHRISDGDNISGRYAFTSPKLLGEVPGAGGNPLQVGQSSQRGQNVLISETHSFTPTIFNEARVAYNRSTYLIGPQNAQDWGPILNWAGLPSMLGAPLVTSEFAIVRDQLPGGYTQRIFQFSDNLFIRKGAHSITTGFDILHKNTNPTFPLGFTELPPYAWVVHSGTTDGSRASTGYGFADFMLGLPFLGVYFNQKAGYISPPMIIRYPDYNFYVQDDWKVSPNLTFNLGLRYELVPVLADTQGETRNFDLATNNLTPVGEVGNKYFRGAHKNFGPRFGFAYRVTDKTVLRGGYGWFYSRTADFGPSALSQNPPNSQLAFIYQPLDPANPLYIEDMFSVVPAGSEFGSVPTGIDPNYTQTPSTQSWSFGIQRQLSPTVLLEAEYKGSLSTHLDGYVDINTPTPGAGDFDPRRPIAGWQGINMHLSAFNSTHHSGLLRLEKRMGRGMSFLGSYAWGKTLDQTYGVASDGGESGAVGSIMDRSNFAREKGLSGMDIRHRAVFSYIYEFPFGPGKQYGGAASGALARLIEGWTFAGITSFQTGPPITIRTNADPANTGQSQQRPDVLSDPTLPRGDRTADRWFNTDAFADPPAMSYRYGNAGRGLVNDPGVNNWDLSLMKNTSISESVRLQFRAEFFNAWNHTQLSTPEFELHTEGFGSIGSASSPRLIQLALKLIW